MPRDAGNFGGRNAAADRSPAATGPKLDRDWL
jgi:hypothetical protein